MPFRITAAAAVVALVIVAATGCTSPPSPTSIPTPTFTSADQAYAAAEKTYRAYVDALNDVDLSDPKTFEAVYAWTTGEALEALKRSLTSMHSEGWTVSGNSVITEAIGAENDTDLHSVDLLTCLDVSQVSVVDPSGKSVVDADRGNTQAMRVTLTQTRSTSTFFSVARIDGREGKPECD